MTSRSTLLSLVTLLVLILLWAYIRSPITPAQYTIDDGQDLEALPASPIPLTEAKVEATAQITGGEDIAMDSHGRVYTGDESGQIWQRSARGQWQRYVTDPLIKRAVGLSVDAQDNLIICDAFNGLLKITADKQVSLLTNQASGIKFGLTDDVDIAADGKIYFSDATHRFDVDNYQLVALDARPSGRLMEYDPKTGKTRVLLDNLFFANGVAVSADGEYVLVNETYAYRTVKYWLKGPSKGRSEVFIEGLPGFPDGISRAPDGSYWIALFGPRVSLLDASHAHPWLKQLIAGLPSWLTPMPAKQGIVLKVDKEGQITYRLRDKNGEKLAAITSAEQYGTQLFMGSLLHQGIGVLNVQTN